MMVNVHSMISRPATVAYVERAENNDEARRANLAHTGTGIGNPVRPVRLRRHVFVILKLGLESETSALFGGQEFILNVAECLPLMDASPYPVVRGRVV